MTNTNTITETAVGSAVSTIGYGHDPVADHDAWPAALHHVADLLHEALEILDAGVPVEDVIDELLIDDGDGAGLLETAGIVLSQVITVAHGPRCQGASAPRLIRDIAAVCCGGCVPLHDVRSALRFARKPTRYVRAEMEASPEHWVRVMVLATAASLRYLSEPYEFIEVLRNAADTYADAPHSEV